MKESRVFITFGPVQSFIGQARTTRDLWTGSYLLSYLGRSALAGLLREGPQIIRPYLTDIEIERLRNNSPLDELESRIGLYPNFMEILTQSSEGKKCAEAAISSWNQTWKSVWQGALDIIQKESNIEDIKDNSIWKSQCESFWEAYWSCGEYHSLTRRKMIRDFSYNDQPGFKCTVCGERTALGPQQNRKKHKEFWIELSLSNSSFKIQESGSERLCAICLTKRLTPLVLSQRLGIKNPPFPSTTSFASLPWLQSVVDSDEPSIQQPLNTLVKLLQQRIPDLWKTVNSQRSEKKKIPEIDGDYFFEDSYSIGRVDIQPDKEKKIALENLRNLVEVSKEFGYGSPDTYYAMLAMDGDSVGELLSNNPEKKSEISKAMSEFAKNAVEIIDQAGGSTIYAGGDDLLAIMPCTTILSAAQNVRGLYTKKMREMGGIDQQPTISAGIVIAHMNAPLQSVYNRTHYLLDQLSKANKTEGDILREKDSFSIEIWDRTGPSKRFTCHWNTGNKLWIDEIEQLKSLLVKGKEVPLTNSFLFSAEDLLSRFNGFQDKEEKLKRLLLVDYLRSREKKIRDLRKTENGMKDAENLINRLFELTRVSSRIDPTHQNDPLTLLRFFSQGGRRQ